MQQFIVQIQWQSSVEYVPIDLSMGVNEGFVETYEIWESGERVPYVASYQRSIDEKGVHCFTLHYSAEENARAAERQGVDLGTSRISFSSEWTKPKANWISDTEPTAWTGPAKKCKILFEPDAELQRKIEHGTRSVIKRPGQVLLREMLLAIDGCCVISQETTTVALEAAHINAVADRGIDGISNGILLRADLHRLFDAGIFQFDLNGAIQCSSDISEQYKGLLENARIDKNIMDRIRANLTARQARHF